MNNKEDYKDLRWSKYILPNGRECYLTQRPDSANPFSVKKFIDEKKPIVRFQFTDDFVDFSMSSPPMHWYPWVPHKTIPLECVFPFVSLMDRYALSNQEGSIWLHCDSSSMRAPTYFGIYVFSNYNAKIAIKIARAMTVSENSRLEYASHSRIDKYIRISLRLDPHIKEFINAWKKHGEFGGHEVYMERDEQILKIADKFMDDNKGLFKDLAKIEKEESAKSKT